MAATLQETIVRLAKKVDELKSAYSQAIAERDRLKEECSGLNGELQRMAEELERVRTDNKFLILSHRLASDPDDVIRARRKISGLISDIDKCISQLKE